MQEAKPFNLFMYGTLMNPAVFRAVLGKRLVLRAGQAKDVDACYARRAVLTGYKKISPDSTYLYAMPDAQGRIRGYLVDDLPQASTVPSLAGFCSSAPPSSIQSPASFSIANRSSMQRAS